MKALEGVLNEELARLLQLEKSYRREIKKLPKGSIQHKKIKGYSYPYLVFRKGFRVVYAYVGNLPKAGLEKLASEIELRRKYKKNLREVKQNIARLRQIVHGRKRAA